MPAATATSSDDPVQIPVDVYQDEDFYVPAFQIVIKGKQLPSDVVQDILSVSYTDSLTDIDSCEFVVNNWDPDKATLDSTDFENSPFQYSDSNLFDPWQAIELYMGYYQGGEKPIKMMTGEITTMTPNFPASGASTLSIRALNLLHRFRTKQETKPFINRKDSDIARELVGDIAKDVRTTQPNLTLQVDSDELNQNLLTEPILNYQILNKQYPIQFLMQRSRDNGYELFVTEDGTDDTHRVVTVHYRPTAASSQIFYRLAWGETLIGFQPTLKTANQVSSLTVQGWDPTGKKKIEETFLRKDLANVVHPVDLDIAESGLSQKEEITADKPVQNVAEARRIAEKRLLQISQDFVEGKGKTIGLPNLRAGSKIQIEGLGTRFSGIYLVTTTTHTIGEGGYTTDFSARMEAKLPSANAANTSNGVAS